MLNRWVKAPPYAAMGFLLRKNRPIPLAGRGAQVCLQVQPVDATYQNGDVDMGTVSLASVGTGTVYRIYSMHSDASDIWDENNDGVAEIRACFSGEDLARLFSRIRGRQKVEAW